ncbi:MAG TPA: cytochrome C oxidase subunit IV family protein [Terriglobales bacterium]|nr:cytochrome C oxidase subunit IV family protein [Terriglobales bacterium]
MTAIHDESKTQYFWVWGGLLLLTAIEVFLAYEQFFAPIKMLLILLGLSVIKAALIILYFMHLKFETRRMRYVLMVAGVVCLSLMSMFFADAVRILRLGVKIS